METSCYAGNGMTSRRLLAPGPFQASQLRSKDPYELSDGHALLCLPTGRRGSTRNLVGGSALETDPKVVSAGVDLGVSTAPGMLRAPDVAVGPIEDVPGWATKAPPLAVEYADVGQDEDALRLKITELLDAGTRFVWVVRLDGEPRVEVHEPGKRMRVARGGAVLRAPGILDNPVPLAVLYDRDAAHEATLRNLLQRKGYVGLEAVREEGREQGREEGREQGREDALRKSIFTVLAARGIDAAPIRGAVLAERDGEVLEQWLRAAATVLRAEDVVDKPRGRRPKR